MSRFVRLCAGLMLVSSLSGCCLLGHGCGSGCSPYGGGYYGGYGSPCQGGACGAMGPGYPSAGLYNSSIPQAAGYGYAAPSQYALLDPLPPR